MYEMLLLYASSGAAAATAPATAAADCSLLLKEEQKTRRELEADGVLVRVWISVLNKLILLTLIWVNFLKGYWSAQYFN